MSKDPDELQRRILGVMAAQSVGHLGMPLNVIRAALPDTSDRLIDRALDRLTRRDLIEAGPVPEMRRLVDRDARVTARQNQEARRSAMAHIRTHLPADDPRDGAEGALEPPDPDPFADVIAEVIANLIATARASRPEPDADRTVERDHEWDVFEILDRPYADDVPLEVRALSEARAWPRRLARLLAGLGGTVVRVAGDVVRERAGSSEDRVRTAARRAQDQHHWLTYLAEVRAVSGQPPASGRI
jgi:hypothetical protein